MKKLLLSLVLFLATTSWATQNINIPGTGDPAWKAPAASVATLPSTGNLVGDARTALDTFNVYVWNGSAWVSVGSTGTVTSVTASSPLVSSGGNTPNITCNVASGAQAGCLASADWTTFNNKQAAGSYITALTGDVTASGPGSAAATIANLAVTNAKIANATIDLTSKVTGQLPVANVASLQVNKYFYVDGQRTDSYTADGSQARPFKTIGAAITQVITNADNATKPYTILLAPGAYAETLTLNSASLVNLSFVAMGAQGTAPMQTTSVTGISSTATNTNLATLIFNGITLNGNLNLSGDIASSNLCSTQCLFIGMQFNNSSGTITLNDVNNVNFYGCQVQGSGSVATFTNVAFAYMQGAEGFLSGTTLHLVQNNGANQPSQASGNYFLLSESKVGATVTIDAGSEMDAIQTYFSSASNITNNGVIHSFQSTWSGASTLNAGSSTRLRGDTINTNPTLSGGAVTTNQSTIYLGTALIGSTAAPATNAVAVLADGHLKSTQTTAPTATVNANAGTGATCTVAHATDLAGQITLVTGSIGTPATGVQCQVNFNKTFNIAPICSLTPANINAGSTTLGGEYLGTVTTSAMPFAFNSAGGTTTTYVYNYQCIETQ